MSRVRLIQRKSMKIGIQIVFLFRPICDLRYVYELLSFDKSQLIYVETGNLSKKNAQFA
jgi:hypothetical protein